MSIPLVHAISLSKYYPSGATVVRAVSQVSITVERGEFLAIVGHSGSGKSTLMSLLGLLERPDSGRYALSGREVTELPDDARSSIRNREIGFVFQLSALLPRASAIENVELPLTYAGVPRTERQLRASKALDRVGLGHRRDHWPHQLSIGEQQRVTIARAIVTNPALLLADEPTGALDSTTGREILALFKDLHREGHSVIVVTHDMSVAGCARRRITLNDGRIVADDVSSGRVAPRSWPASMGIPA